MAYGTVNADVIGTSVAGSNLGAGDASLMKNRIINGAMVIDQRNAGASFTPTNGGFGTDRWKYTLSQTSKITGQQSSTAPTGFSNSLLTTSSSAYSIGSGDYFAIYQSIEGFNFADCAWGTANAKTVTLSFQVYSSLTGTFGGSITNSGQSRCYPFSYTVSTANTWTTVSVTIAGDTTGTWIGATNGIGAQVWFGLGVGSTYSGTAGAWNSTSFCISATGATSVVGTNGATFYITGVQLEVGSSATGYEYRLYNQELIACQRYYNKYFFTSGSGPTGFNDSSTKALIFYNYPSTMRATPTVETTGTASDYQIRYTGNTANLSAVPSLEAATNQQIRFACNVASGLTAGQGVALIGSSTSIYVALTAEL